MSANILIVEDEEALSQVLAYNFAAEGFRVRTLDRGEDVNTAVADERPDLIVLDWMLPGMSGIDVCRSLQVRAETRSIPVLMLTARGEEHDRLRGLSLGADDYMTKPFSVPELMARTRAILRRAQPQTVADQLVAGDLVLDRRTRRVTRGARDLNLSPTEFKLLEQLMQTPGRVYSRTQLLDLIWGRENYVDERTVDVHVGRLRKCLSRGREADPVRTVRAMGYAFDERFGRA